MRLIETVSDFRNWRRNLTDASLGFVPTMGALHQGHVSLFLRSKSECDLTVASIFVNPTQFNDPKDLEKYPRPLEHDIRTAEQTGVDVLFLPQAKELYSDDYRYRISENRLSRILCGGTRPGHFEGVLTVVAKLLNITSPQRAYFGEKDYQQYLLIRDMARALYLASEIICLPTVREPDGLAMSSRNGRLTQEQRRLAPRLYEQLKSRRPLDEMRGHLESAGFRIEYLEEHFGRRFAAVLLGDVRLIDNV